MPGILRCKRIDLNKKENVETLRNSLKEIISQIEYLDLEVAKKYYFKLNEPITTNPGWYVILDENKSPLYVGKAQNLNSRLNTENGSRDQFANPQRTSDPERNFIKKFYDENALKELYVCPINEQVLCDKLGIEYPLPTLDRNNIEKFINVFRGSLFRI